MPFAKQDCFTFPLQTVHFSPTPEWKSNPGLLALWASTSPVSHTPAQAMHFSLVLLYQLYTVRQSGGRRTHPPSPSLQVLSTSFPLSPFHRCPLSGEEVPDYPLFPEVWLWMGTGLYQTYFLHQQYSRTDLLLLPMIWADYSDWFLNVEPALHAWSNSFLVTVYNHFYAFLIWLSSNFFENFFWLCLWEKLLPWLRVPCSTSHCFELSGDGLTLVFLK